MIQRYGRLNFRSKLLVHSILAASLALVLAITAFLTVDLRASRTAVERDLRQEALHVSASVGAAIAFEDRGTAQAQLALLGLEPHVMQASIHLNDGSLFGYYVREGADVPAPPRRLGGQTGFVGDRFLLREDIVLRGEPLGSLRIERDLADLRARTRSYFGIAGVVFAIALLATTISAAVFARLLSRPVHELVDVAERISRTEDYSIRAAKLSRDELGTLTDSFNAMLGEIQRRDGALQRARAELESRVVARTRDLERSREDLRVAKNAAEQASAAKGEFLANMSHEIRTPMNGVIGMAEVLLRLPLEDRQREYVGMLKSSADSLMRLLNDILDFSKIEAGHLELEALPFGLRDTVGDAVQSLAGQVDSGVELIYRIAPDIPDGVVGDAGRLRQILVNLVGNAIKFTKRGEVALDVRAHAISPSRISLEFSIRDTGSGIPDDKLSAIFDAFSQADSSMSRRYGGTGLGLAIAAELVARMGGQIWVESVLGRGSVFHVTSAFERATLRTRPPVDATQLVGLRVLVVDDNPTSQTILRELLTHWQMIPEAAHTGTEALSILENSPSDSLFDLVMLDAMLPEMTGIALAAAIRTEAGLRDLPLLMLTSSGTTPPASLLDECGIRRCLTKPTKESDLLAAIRAAIELPATTPVSSRAAITPERSITPLRLLLAEDGQVNQEVVTRLLEQRGHSVIVANDGEEAVQCVEKGPAFDAVLMDVQMPRMDGFEATRALRERDRQLGTHQHIIAMTAHAIKGDRERCLKAGMDDYLSKPIHAEALFAVVEGLPPANGSAAPDRGIGAFDRNAALEQLGGDLTVLSAAVMVFVEEAPGLVGALRKAIECGDGHNARATAHRLKSSLGVFAATAAAACAERIEHSGESIAEESIANEMDSLAREVDRLLPQLIEFANRAVPWHAEHDAID